MPIVDLFSGPGGLGEGFTAFRSPKGRRRFRIELSIEKDRAAHRTLLLRAFLRQFGTRFPSEYYDFLNGVTDEPDWAELYPKHWASACDDTKCLELGTPDADGFLQRRIGQIRAMHGGRTMFFAYNNGITATAEEVEIEDDGGRLSLCRLKNFQIVNGGQTTASIHAAKRAKVDLSRTFVQMKLSVVSQELGTRLVPKISEFANSQNRVNAADFFANHPFHVRMEEFSRRIHAPTPDGTFRQSKWFYERARGQYADARAGLTQSERKKFDLEHPRSQLFTKTDLAKFVNVWNQRPHEVSLGAQKNFAIFAGQIGQAWKKNPNDLNESWYREAIAKGIVFKATERLVSEQPWYQGGYRANIVAYAIAKVAHDVDERERAVDFQGIWRRQKPTPAIKGALTTAAEAVHEVLIDPTPGISNVTEWAKKQACWERVRRLTISWPRQFLSELISAEERRDAALGARREQRELNAIEAQIAVVEAGAAFWAEVLAWGNARELFSPTELQVLSRLASGGTPAETQAVRAIEALRKLQSEGYTGELARLRPN